MTTKTKSTTTHKQEIEATRVGGFGGSDAKMFYRVGLKGLSALTNSDKKRIRVAKGIDEYKPIYVNDAMQRGHDFEGWYEDISKKEGYKNVREKKFTRDLSVNFETFFHADFSDKNSIYELKCVSDIFSVQEDYFEQLQWQHMISGMNVYLIVSDSEYDFENHFDAIPIKRDERAIEILQNGIKLIDENWETLDLNVGEEWNDSDLMPFEQREIEQMTLYLSEIKTLEAKADEMKANLFEMMKANNITSLKSEKYVINLIGESTTATLDKKKLFTTHPEIKEQDYLKTSPKKAYLKITLKN